MEQKLDLFIHTSIPSWWGREERKGWFRDGVTFAILNLAVAQIAALDANLDTEDLIAQAGRSVHGMA